jgi:hypothetical protein
MVFKRLTTDHWHKSLQNNPNLAGDYELKAAQLKREKLLRIAGTTRSNLPVGDCWILERRFGDEFAQPKAGGGSQVNVQVNVGLPGDVKGRVSSLRRKLKVVSETSIPDAGAK